MLFRSRTVFWPDRYRVRLDDEAVYVYDAQTKYIRLGAKYWASRRLANNFLLQHYHHQSFSAVNEIYHESYDPTRLSKASSTHSFVLFVFHLILLHSESTGTPFLSSPTSTLVDVIKSADFTLFAGGRRLVGNHSCTKCTHRLVEEGAVPAAGAPAEVAQNAHHGADVGAGEPARAGDEYVNMWVVDGVTLGPVVRGCALKDFGRTWKADATSKSCAEPRCPNAPANYRSVSGRWCEEHMDAFFGPDALDVPCGIIGCEKRMVRRSVVPNALIPNDPPNRVPDDTDSFYDRYPACDEHIETLEFYLSRYGDRGDYHAVQRWGRDRRNQAREIGRASCRERVS